jgi:2-polyprenyl-6-methoxyphenol hydroxylase-like FAD-dependent oxidoreductase
MDHILDAEFIFGDSIEAISQSSDSVQVAFKKNSAREFDLVIGADGLHSNVRGLVFGDESRFVRDLGLYMRLHGAELSEAGPDGDAVLRAGESGCDLELSR